MPDVMMGALAHEQCRTLLEVLATPVEAVVMLHPQAALEQPSAANYQQLEQKPLRMLLAIPATIPPIVVGVGDDALR
jgi:hypothetical protein